MAVENTERGIGLELLQTEITLVLFNQLNEEIDSQQAKWESRDEDWGNVTGQDPNYVVVEQIEPENFHNGHRPSLILNDTPRESYPNVSVMVYQGGPTDIIIDQASNFSIMCDIEIMVKSEESEAETDRRCHRTVEAVHQVLLRNEGLNGKSLGWNNDPNVQITDIFKRQEHVSTGNEWYWQAARIRYQLTRHARLSD